MWKFSRLFDMQNDEYFLILPPHPLLKPREIICLIEVHAVPLGALEMLKKFNNFQNWVKLG